MKKILVIQNNEDEIKEINSILPKDEFEIFYSHNLHDGLKISVRYSPDIILFYLNNDINSLGILSEITNGEKTSSIPLIVISEINSYEQFRTVMDIGADDFLPVELLDKSLLNSVSKRLDKLYKIKERINNHLNYFDEETDQTQIDDHILIKIGNKLKLVKFAEIVCVTALKEYSKLTTKDNCKIVVRKSLKNWISLLPAKCFLQIHRATIINIDCIEKIVKTNDRTYTVNLLNIPESFDISHRYANIIRHKFPT